MKTYKSKCAVEAARIEHVDESDDENIVITLDDGDQVEYWWEDWSDICRQFDTVAKGDYYVKVGSREQFLCKHDFEQMYEEV